MSDVYKRQLFANMLAGHMAMLVLTCLIFISASIDVYKRQALTLLGAVREFLGTGKIFNLSILPEEYGRLVFVLAPGAFIALGYLIALINSMKKN